MVESCSISIREYLQKTFEDHPDELISEIISIVLINQELHRGIVDKLREVEKILEKIETG